MIVFCHHGRIITTRFTFEEDLGHGNGIKTFSFTHLKNKMLVLTSCITDLLIQWRSLASGTEIQFLGLFGHRRGQKLLCHVQ